MISIVLPTYNRSRELLNTLKSFYNLLDRENLCGQIIVVNNNSTDNTEDVILQFQKEVDAKVVYVKEERQGKSHALTTGINLASGDVLAFTDDDCQVAEDWLVSIHEVMKDQTIDAIAGKVICVLDEEVPDWLDIDKLKGPLAHYDKGENYIESTKEKRILPTGANVVLRKRAIKEYGGFQYHGRAEDTELGYRWNQKGAKIVYAPNVVVRHYNNASRFTKDYFRKWYFLGGKNTSIILKEEFLTGRVFLGVPFWVYREILSNSLKFF